MLTVLEINFFQSIFYYLSGYQKFSFFFFILSPTPPTYLFIILYIYIYFKKS